MLFLVLFVVFYVFCFEIRSRSLYPGFLGCLPVSYFVLRVSNLFLAINNFRSATRRLSVAPF